MSDIAGHHFGAAAVDSDLAARLRAESVRHWKLLLAIGILCDLVGVYSILVPVVASISATVLVGWALLVGGIVQLAHALRRDLGWSWDVAWRLLVAVITVVAGAWILIAPLTGTVTLTFVLIAWFWAIGVTRLIAWWEMRRVEHSWTVLLNGLLSLVLGILIWADFPDSSAWAIGLLVGIELLFAGSALIMMAFAGRQLAKSAAA